MASTALCFDTDCKLMAHFDTDFTDSSVLANTLNLVGNTQISGTLPKFGAGSALFDGAGDAITIADNAAFDIGTGDFTFEVWIKLSSTAIFHEIIGSTAGVGDWIDYYWDKGGGGQYIIRLQNTLISGPMAFAAGTWAAFAIARAGTSCKVFKDGVTQGTHVNSSNITLAGSIEIGNTEDAVGDFSGNMDEMRLVIGTAVYTGDYTPASGAFTDCNAVVGGGGVAATPRRRLKTLMGVGL